MGICRKLKNEERKKSETIFHEHSLISAPLVFFRSLLRTKIRNRERESKQSLFNKRNRRKSSIERWKAWLTQKGRSGECGRGDVSRDEILESMEAERRAGTRRRVPCNQKKKRRENMERRVDQSRIQALSGPVFVFSSISTIFWISASTLGARRPCRQPGNRRVECTTRALSPKNTRAIDFRHSRSSASYQMSCVKGLLTKRILCSLYVVFHCVLYICLILSTSANVLALLRYHDGSVKVCVF